MASGAWVRIPSPSTRQRWLLTFGSLAIASLFLWSPVGLVTRLVERATGPSPLVQVGLPILLVAAVVVIAYLVVAERTAPPAIDVARQLLRIGRKEWGFSEVTGARIELAGGPGDDSLILRLTTTGDESCSVVVSTREGVRIDDAQRDALLALVAGSRIAPPRSKDDPHGRFAHVEFPGHLTLEDTAALVDGSGVAEPTAARGQRGQGSGARNVRPAGTPSRNPISMRAQYVVAGFVTAMGVLFAVAAVRNPAAVFGRTEIPVVALAVFLLAGGIGTFVITRRDARRAASQRAAVDAARAESEAERDGSAEPAEPAPPAEARDSARPADGS
ncbi:membrane protein [Clavibacter michiganensis]|uniref:membrane protein n=1 Tax=Clavibacter michiganensis TaxID=28447 RepID=UPI0005BE4282|nr:membrane protein [Clavibacter michiganensis]